MTHEELLAKIDELSWKDDSELLAPALRAVVELPMEGESQGAILTNDLADSSVREVAERHYEFGYNSAMRMVIQAIEKELK